MGELGFAPQRLQLKEGARITSEDKQSTSAQAGVGSQRELLSAPLKRILKGDRFVAFPKILDFASWIPQYCSIFQYLHSMMYILGTVWAS